MTEPSPARIPWLLDGIRRQAEQLLEQTAEVEAWIAARKVTYEEVIEHQYKEMCQCEGIGPNLCDQHASIMLMVGGPMDGETLFHRLAGPPLAEITFALPQVIQLLPRDDATDLFADPLARATYRLTGRLRGRDVTQSRVWTYTCG